MRLKLFIVALAFIGYTNVNNAQIDVTINPIGLLFGDFSVGADFVLSDNFSVEGTVGFGTGGLSALDIDTYKWTNIPISAIAKYYFNPDDGADGFYADVFAKFINRSYKWEGDNTLFGDGNFDYSQTRLGLGIGIGYKIVSNGGIVFDFGFGIGRALVSNTKYNDEVDPLYLTDWTKIMFQGKLGLGYRFGR